MLSSLRVAAIACALVAVAPARAQVAPAPEAPAAPLPAAAPAAPRPPLPADELVRGEPVAPGIGGTESLLSELVRTLLVLALVVALAWLSLNWGLRKLLRIDLRQSGAVRVHERMPLEPKKSLYLVEVAGDFLLVGVGESEISMLARLDPERAKEALAHRPKPPARGRPFWERLAIKPPSRGGPGSPPPESPSGSGPPTPTGS